MMLGNGYGFNWKGLYVTSLVDAHSAWRERADELSETLKTTILFGKYALDKYRGHYYAKAQNLARKLGAAYDTALAKYDLLLMPTLPLRATKLLLVMGVHGGGDTLNDTANGMNTDAHNAQMACALAGTPA